MPSLTIAHRFRGPPHSGNGGYVCGMLARHVEAAGAEVTLLRPPPLETALAIACAPGSLVELRQGDALVATAKPAVVEIAPLPTPSFAEAQDAASRTPYDHSNHLLPMCFVCGVDRAEGDGLRICAGPLGQSGDDTSARPFASHWVPAADLADDTGLVASEFVWAALDCPTGYAALGSRLAATTGSEAILLGRLAVHMSSRPAIGERCIIVAQARGREGRKLMADGALYGGDGKRHAVARATWIVVDPNVQRGTPSAPKD